MTDLLDKCRTCGCALPGARNAECRSCRKETSARRRREWWPDAEEKTFAHDGASLTYFLAPPRRRSVLGNPLIVCFHGGIARHGEPRNPGIADVHRDDVPGGWDCWWLFPKCRPEESLSWCGWDIHDMPPETGTATMTPSLDAACILTMAIPGVSVVRLAGASYGAVAALTVAVLWPLYVGKVLAAGGVIHHARMPRVPYRAYIGAGDEYLNHGAIDAFRIASDAQQRHDRACIILPGEPHDIWSRVFTPDNWRWLLS